MTTLTQIRRLLVSMDDDALAAMSNKGLLRRAKKDLETIVPEIIEAGDTFVRMQVGDCEVTIPENPIHARSNSPAGTIDRHVLAAFLWLRDQPCDDMHDSGSLHETDAMPVLQEQSPETLGDETLIRWAGKATFRKTLMLLDGELSCLVENKLPLTIRVPQRNIVCRWVDGGNLETMIVTGPDKDTKSNGLLAILLYQIAKGIRIRPVIAGNTPDASREAPRTRAEVLDSLEAVLQEMIVLGLTRLSESTQQRLQTLAVSAHGVDLPRLERMIQSLAEDVGLQRNRNAQASTSKLLASAARLDALRRALKNRLGDCTTFSQASNTQTVFTKTPLADLIGEHRSRYHAVGDIELIGMGARRWATKSGYTGLTVYFWDSSANDWSTWSESRPIGTNGFDPVAVYYGDGPWQGCPSPMFASQNIVKLLGAWRNGNGRLSARRTTQAICVEISDATIVTPPQVVYEWESLQERVTRLFTGSLARRKEQKEIVFLKPSRWEPPVFDEISQCVVRPIVDTKGTMIPLVVVHDETNAAETLEKYIPTRNLGILGLVRLSNDNVAIEPVSLFDADKVHNLTLGTRPSKRLEPSRALSHSLKHDVIMAEDNDVDEEDHAAEPLAEHFSGRIGDLFRLARSELEAVAEAGLGAVRNPEPLIAVAERLKSAGLTVCSTPLERFAEEHRKACQSLDAKAVFRVAAALLESCCVIMCLICCNNEKR